MFSIRKILLLLFIAILICCYYYRNDILFRFQYYQLQKIACKSDESSTLPCFTKKLWVHRVNSLQRFHLLKDYFQGFESDVYYDSSINDFWIWHPPGSRPINLYMDSLLNDVNAENKKIWLDMRGIDSSNAQRTLDLFERKIQQYHLKQNMIIELYDVSAANRFAARGFNVSLNVQTSLLKKKDNDELISLRQKIASEVHYVSQSEEYVDSLKSKLPGKKIVTWSLPFNNYFHTEKLQKLVDDTLISVVLINVKSRYHY